MASSASRIFALFGRAEGSATAAASGRRHKQGGQGCFVARGSECPPRAGQVALPAWAAPRSARQVKGARSVQGPAAPAGAEPGFGAAPCVRRGRRRRRRWRRGLGPAKASSHNGTHCGQPQARRSRPGCAARQARQARPRQVLAGAGTSRRGDQAPKQTAARQTLLFFCRTFFRQAAVKQGETRDRSLRARRPTGVGQDIPLQRRAGVRVANVGGELAEARSERSLRCDCKHLPPPAPVRGCDSRALRRGAGESSALRDAVEEGLSLLAPSPSNFEGQHRQATPPGSLKLRVGYPTRREIGCSRHAEAG